MTSKEKERAVEKIIDASETKSSGEQIVGDNTLVIDREKDNDLNDYLDNSIFKNIRTINQNEIENSLLKQKISSDVEEMYSGTFSEITENSLIQGRVVGMNDRDVLIDIGFKSNSFETYAAVDNWDIACDTLKKNKISKGNHRFS